MFAYCNNNPVICKDETGYDAVVLLDDDFIGHIGMLIQDKEGKWWHFYYGTKGTAIRITCALGFPVPAYSWCVEYASEIDLNSINSAKQFDGDYEDMIYLTGDFSDSLKKAKRPDLFYNLFLNNCSQVTLDILSESDTMNKEVLDKASEYVLPKNAFNHVRRNKVYPTYHGNGGSYSSKYIMTVA